MVCFFVQKVSVCGSISVAACLLLCLKCILTDFTSYTKSMTEGIELEINISNSQNSVTVTNAGYLFDFKESPQIPFCYWDKVDFWVSFQTGHIMTLWVSQLVKNWRLPTHPTIPKCQFWWVGNRLKSIFLTKSIYFASGRGRRNIMILVKSWLQQNLNYLDLLGLQSLANDIYFFLWKTELFQWHTCVISIICKSGTVRSDHRQQMQILILMLGVCWQA